MTGVLAALMLAAGGTGGCGSQAGHGIITGTFIRAGGPAPGSPVPLAGQIVATGTGGARYSATTTRNGRYSLSLPAGTYQLAGYSPQVREGQADMRCTAEHPVRVTAAGRTAGAEVVCSIP